MRYKMSFVGTVLNLTSWAMCALWIVISIVNKDWKSATMFLSVLVISLNCASILYRME